MQINQKLEEKKSNEAWNLEAKNIHLLSKHCDVVISFTWWTEIECHTILSRLLNNIALQSHTLKQTQITHKNEQQRLVAKNQMLWSI